MLAKDASRVSAGRTGFLAEGGGVGDVFDGQVFDVENFVAVQVDRRDFGGRIQVQLAVVVEFEGVFFELRELSGAVHRSFVDDVGRNDFAVAVLLGMEVHHEHDQGRSRRAPRPL
jgi:hypothetical protein